MAAKKPRNLGTIATVLFSSIVGPLLVQVIMIALRSDDHTWPVSASAAKSWTSQYQPVPDPEESVIAQGVGSTPESAWDDAVKNGLRTAVLEQVDAKTRARDGTGVWAAVLKDCQGLITRCVDLGCTGRPGFWRRQVAVFVDRAAVTARLQSLRSRSRGHTS